MAKKVPLEIKSKALKHYLTNKPTFKAFKLYVCATYGYDVSRQALMKWVSKKDDILGTQNCIGKVFLF